MDKLMIGLTAYMRVFNIERPHQSLGYQTPDQVYRTGIGGGAIIVYKVGGTLVEPCVALCSTTDSTSTETETMPKEKPGSAVRLHAR